MAMDIAKKKCITPEFRVSYPNVFKPKAFKDQDAKYSLVMVFDEGVDLTKMKVAVRNAIVEKLGEDKATWPKKLRLPFRDGAEREDTEGYGPGKIFVSASSKTQPGLVNKNLERIINEADFYAGCRGHAELIAFYYDVNGNKGVSFSLQNLQKSAEDKPFSGRKKAEEVFSIIDDGSDDMGSYAANAESGDLDFGV